MSYRLSNEKSDLDLDWVHSVLSTAYWAQGIPREIVEQSIEHSYCFSAFDGERQIAFARIVTDYSTFAYLGDVIVRESYRGYGVGKALMTRIMNDSRLSNIRRWHLVTHDAHGLYEPFGFRALEHPEWHMGMRRPNPYGAQD